MNLEAVEQKCISYLEQVKNPLAPFSTLFQHVSDDENCGQVSEQLLLDFLRNHQLFKVIDPPTIEDAPGWAGELPDAGIATGIRVILCSRIPSRAELSNMMQEQLGIMLDALAKALAEARRMGDTETCDKVLDALAHAEQLKKNLKQMMS